MIASKSFCSRVRLSAVTDRSALPWVAAGILFCALAAQPAMAGHEAPDWVHAAAAKPLPPHDEKATAALLYSDTTVTVVSKDKIRTHVRQVYKILRPEGRHYGNFFVYTSAREKVTFMRGWSIPVQGKDYETQDKEILDQAPMAIPGIELITDLRRKFVQIPAADPGNVVAYEYETEEQPYFLQGQWHIQKSEPVKETRYRLELPEGWEYKAAWIHHAEISPQKTGSNQWEWSATDVPGIRHEEQMPPIAGIASGMIVSFIPPGGVSDHTNFLTWNDMGKWYDGLTGERMAATPPIKQETSSITSTQANTLAKMQAIAEYIQNQIRYIAIELGIGGWQPHSAADVFAHRYGDCKDKATLTISMLHGIGIEAYYVIINASRDAVGGDDPAHNGFNHAITAIRLPAGLDDPSLLATIDHPKLGRLLFFDPTDEVTPFGRIRGALQANYGLLVGPDGGELVELPVQQPVMAGIKRQGKLELDANGTLYGEIAESRLGDRAAQVRWSLRSARADKEKTEIIETLLSDSLGSFQLTGLNFSHVDDREQPLGVNYAFQTRDYAKNAGDMLLVRPRVLGSKSSGLLETSEPRKFAIEFDSPVRDFDDFDITLPSDYEVADIPSPVDVDFGFADYHSKTEVTANILHYTRTFEVKDVRIPASKADELKKFYRIIATDERNNVVLKRRMPAPQAGTTANQ